MAYATTKVSKAIKDHSQRETVEAKELVDDLLENHDAAIDNLLEIFHIIEFDGAFADKEALEQVLLNDLGVDPKEVDRHRKQPEQEN